MNLIHISLPLLIAAGVPLLFLFIAYSFDLYNTQSVRFVGMAFLWGGVVGLGLAYTVNTYVTRPLLAFFNLGYILLYIVFAPVVEELIKTIPLIYCMRQGHLTFFIDSAIFGFATGIGFSIGETFLYINRYPDLALPLAVARAFSTSLMHGTATALIGVAYGLVRLRRFRTRKGWLVAAGLLAVTFHGLFNALAISGQHPLIVILIAMAFGIGTFELLLVAIRRGLEEEKMWLGETLDPHILQPLVGMLSPVERQQLTEALEGIAQMSVAEIKATQGYENLDELLAPLREQFPEQADRMEQIVFLQAQIGIKRRLIWEVGDPKVQERLQAQITTLIAKLQQYRKEMGSCEMAYLNCVFDDEGKPMYACMESVSSCAVRWSQQNSRAPGSLADMQKRLA